MYQVLIPFLSPPGPFQASGRNYALRGKGTERKRATAQKRLLRFYRDIIKENIEYDILIQDPHTDREQLDEIVDLMLETICSARKTICVRRGRLPRRDRQIQVPEAGQYAHPVCFRLPAGKHDQDTQHQEISAGRAIQRAVHDQRLLYRACQSRYGKWLTLSQGRRAGKPIRG